MSCEPTHAEDRPGDQGRQLAENGAITKSERASLLQVARLRARVAKDQVAAFAAKLRADFEKQLDAHYPWDSDETWTALAKLMEKTKQEAQARVAARSREQFAGQTVPMETVPIIGSHERRFGVIA